MSIFITLEGGEGSGKSTQAKLLHEYLETQGYDVLSVHEPGGTGFGNQLRKLLLDWSSKGKDAIDHRAQVLGFCTARAQLVSKLIIPRLEQPNTITITDRFADSTIAYQVYGSGYLEDRDEVIKILSYTTRKIVPDLTIYLDIGIKEGLNRVQGRIKKSQESYQYETAKQFSFIDENYFESQNLQFHHRVREGYEWLMKQDGDRWFRVKANQSEHEVFLDIFTRVERLIIRNNITRTKRTAGR